MTRRHSSKRTYLYACPKCDRWHAVPTLEVQAQCRKAGACPRCQQDAQWLLKVKLAAIEEHLDRLVTLGKAAPSDQRDVLRQMYVKKAAQLADTRKQLEALTVGEQVEV